MLGGGDEGWRVGDGGSAWQHGPGIVVEAQGQRMTWWHTPVHHRAATPLPQTPRAPPHPCPVPPGQRRARVSLLRLCPDEPPASVLQTPPPGSGPSPGPLTGPPVSTLVPTSHSPPRDKKGLHGGSPGSPRPRAVSLPGAHGPEARRAPAFHRCSLPRSLRRPLLFPASGPLHLLSPRPACLSWVFSWPVGPLALRVSSA